MSWLCVNLATLNYNSQSSLSYMFLAKVSLRDILLGDLGVKTKQPPSYSSYILICWLTSCCGAPDRLATVPSFLDPPATLTPVPAECLAPWWAYHLLLQYSHNIKVRGDENWHSFSPSLCVPTHACETQRVLALFHYYGLNCAPSPPPRKMYWSPYPQGLRMWSNLEMGSLQR